MAVGAEMVVVAKAGVEHRLFLGLRHGVVFAFVALAQTDVFHGSAPLDGGQQRGCCRFFFHCFK